MPAPVIKVVFITTPGTGTFTVPSDFDKLISVEAIGGGGAGGSGGSAGGGGGGQYNISTTVTGLSAGGTAYYQVGTGGICVAGSNGQAGTSSWFNATVNSAPGIATDGVLASAGSGGARDGGAGGGGAGGSGGIGSGGQFSGGSGGGGSSGKGGGGGAGGIGGAGGTGATSTGASGAGGAGGGSGATLTVAGTAGTGNAGTANGGAGGASAGQTGGSGAVTTTPANSTTAPLNGGGGGGGSSNIGVGGGAGSNGTYWQQSSNSAQAGSGGGGGGAGSNNSTGGAGGLYGGGGGGSQSGAAGASGAQGIVVFTYYARNGSGFTKDDPVFGTIDLDDQYVTDSWLVDKYVGGTYYNWGRNDNGQLGQNFSGTNYSSPIQVGSLTNWKSTLGQQTNLAVKVDGTLWAWGLNAGVTPLGINNTANTYSSPVQVGALSNWKQVSCGTFLSGATTIDGKLYMWGSNYSGALGNGNTAYYSSPVQVGTLSNWNQLAAGGGNISGDLTFAHATKTDGTLWGWGAGVYGVLGNGATAYYSSPIQIGSLTNWKYVASGAGYWTMAIKTDGTLWAWGFNARGQLGLNNTAYYSSPVQVGSLTNWKQVVCSGDGSTYAIKTDGTLWAWGQNSLGELGNGNRTYYSSPIQIGALTNWKFIAAGGGEQNSVADSTNVLAIKTDGTLWAWGCNGYGQLGNGNRTYYSSPVQVGSLTNWKYVASGLGVSAGITFADLT